MAVVADAVAYVGTKLGAALTVGPGVESGIGMERAGLGSGLESGWKGQGQGQGQG